MYHSSNIVKVLRCSKSLSSKALSNAAEPAKYTLATVRAFPSLEPLTFAPVPTSVLGSPLRRDILWRAVVYENDNKRVGSSNPPGRSENGYSRRKLLPQKGSGRARAGDANSPTRHNGARAHARTAPNDYSTALPSKVYSLAYNVALSHQYRQGNLFVIGGNNELCGVHKNDLNELELVKDPENTGELIFEKFLKEYDLEKKKNLLFIVDGVKEGLLYNTEKFAEKIDIISKEFVDVNDILKAQRVFIELSALEYLAVINAVESFE
ncbi:probable 54S ribosomal protein YmL6, mitochondrial [Saccharomycodes ludwigii]|uniref:Large ribosomal subunit protein uL4m n=1 Tax=Saccharomycodes ludwigii TaxID=36035 RepID=A0A376B4T2_9ASCO|nr:hypothetical protein SCDLUD_004938 [Saccharomycodes ludwigii]KAH3899493.1 hypothetical protein SCDLUD_004938 [Saccharomycodes ludwigii]SSD59140.1 probable 54S ribosomal protein YmL6, mitochondrial [Saccharomycodes ludwigii]